MAAMREEANSRVASFAAARGRRPGSARCMYHGATQVYQLHQGYTPGFGLNHLRPRRYHRAAAIARVATNAEERSRVVAG